MSADPQVRCAVLGSPIEHSLSPVLHQAAYRALGLSRWHYGRQEVPEGGLAEFVANCDASWRGLSLTMPLKVEAMRLGQVDPIAELAGVANTLVFSRSAAGRRIDLFNTDVAGFVLPLMRRFSVTKAVDVPIGSAVVLGGGATARSAFVALTKMGVEEITVAARTKSKVEQWEPLFEATGVRPTITGFLDFSDSDLLISTVTAGAADALAVRVAETQRAVFDVIYDPWPTRLASAAEQNGRVLFSGLDLLAYQAVEQVRLMTGQRVDPEVLLTAGREALGSSPRR